MQQAFSNNYTTDDGALCPSPLKNRAANSDAYYLQLCPYVVSLKNLEIKIEGVPDGIPLFSILTVVTNSVTLLLSFSHSVFKIIFSPKFGLNLLPSLC